jgi:polysaccharide biosynthesis/export protein
LSFRVARRIGTAALLAALGACANLPGIGPSLDEVQAAARAATGGYIQVVEVDDRVSRQLRAQRGFRLFSEALGADPQPARTIGIGDTLEVTIWEAPPATLFGSAPVDPRSLSTSRSASFPDQTVGRDGQITVPFAGRIQASGRSPQEVEAEIARRLRGRANQPEVLVRIVRNASATVTVIGEVASSLRIPLTDSGERLLDALAAAGGTRQPVSKMTVQLTRGGRYHSLPLDLVIRDPRQNVPLLPGDVVTAIHQPLSFTALGATGKNEEIPFEAQGITLAQALARSGGLIDTRSNPQGVFLFRLEPSGALDWPNKPAAVTPEGMVPVVYRIDLRDPASFFVMQGFPISDKDVLYVSNAPATELQKFLNLVFSAFYPVANLINVTR